MLLVEGLRNPKLFNTPLPSPHKYLASKGARALCGDAAFVYRGGLPGPRGHRQVAGRHRLGGSHFSLLV